MSVKKYSYPMDSDIVESVRGLTTSAVKLKTSIFKAKFRGEKVDRGPLDHFMRKANEFLKTWDDFAEDVADSMKEYKGSEEAYSIEYGYVKNWIFAKYDYASVLPFTDGVFRGVKDGKFDTVEDIEDFRDHTTEKAFGDCADTIGGLVDAVISSGIGPDGRQSAGKLGLSHYQSVRNSGKIFNASDRRTIYNAIKKTMDYLIEHIDELNSGSSYKNTRMYVSAVNNIVDYGVYTMVAFATRAFIIGSYAYPFISASTRDDKKDEAESVSTTHMAESIQILPDEHHSCTSCAHVMKDADDAILKAPSCAKEFCKTFEAFLTDIDAVPKVGHKPTYERPYISYSARNSTSYCDKLRDNPIYDFILGDGSFRISDTPDATLGRFNELVVTFRDFMYDHKLALPNQHSPRDEFLHIIRGVEPEKQDLNGYKENAYDLYVLAISLVNRMEYMINNISNIERVEKNSPTSNAGTANDVAECLRIMNYVYREITHALLQKARYIEAKINWLQQEDLNKTIAGVQIKIPGMKNDGPLLNDYMMSSVPDTVKMPAELIDIYALPVFEAAELFDESLRVLPEFRDDLYLSEAVGLSQLINAIKALIAGARKRFENFWNDKTVQAAVKWTNTNGDNLKKMNFSGKTLAVLPYKDDIKFGQYAKKMIDEINAIDINSLKTNEDVTAAVRKLYPDDHVYAFFAGSADQKSAARKYRNFILFQEPGAITDKPVDRVTYDGEMLQKKVGVWVDTVKGSKEVFDLHGNLTKQLDSAIESLKNKVVGATSGQQTTTQATTQTTAQPVQPQNGQEPPPTPTVNGGNEPGKETTTPSQPAQPQAQNTQPQGDKAAVLNFLLTEVQNAENRIWVPATNMFIEYIKAHYQNIRSMYGIAQPQNGQLASETTPNQ